MNEKWSTEKAVIEHMKTPNGKENAYLCYYDFNISSAYTRFFASEEWNEVRSLISTFTPPSNCALDLGAGNGIGSFALYRDGYKVISLEPDPSELTGHGALTKFKNNTDVPINCISGIGESLPFKSQSFGLVYCRQVLHHATNLQQMMKEIHRVLLPGGIFIATREHIIDDEESLVTFLNNHPLHNYTHSEGAFTLETYRNSLINNGLSIKKMLLSWDSVINHYPTSNEVFLKKYHKALKNRFGFLGVALARNKQIEHYYRKRKSNQDKKPGRMISFVAKAH